MTTSFFQSAANKDLSARHREKRRCRKGKEARCVGSPGIASCAALRQVLSSKLPPLMWFSLDASSLASKIRHSAKRI